MGRLISRQEQETPSEPSQHHVYMSLKTENKHDDATYKRFYKAYLRQTADSCRRGWVSNTAENHSSAASFMPFGTKRGISVAVGETRPGIGLQDSQQLTR